MSITVTPAEPIDKVTCKFCRRQFAKYTCPTCNAPYCSLTCFRAQEHAGCSETFYKKEVEADIRSAPGQTKEEKVKMMQVLKKFEEESAQKEDERDPEAQDGEEDEDDLTRRFESIDLENMPSSELWTLLPSSHRAKFLKALEDPTSELAQQLLASEELEKYRKDPWWDTSSASLSVNADDITKPGMMHIPKALVKPSLTGPPLVYNVCAICLAYAFTVRHLGASRLDSLTPSDVDYSEASSLIRTIVPFLVDKKSTVLHSSLDEVITDVWSRIEEGGATSRLFALLLHDTAHLIRPLNITLLKNTEPLCPSTLNTECDLTNHPHTTPILVLSDLTSLFTLPTLTPSPVTSAFTLTKSNKNPVTHKLLFYAAHIISTPSAVLRAVAAELEDRSKAFEIEADGTGTGKRDEVTRVTDGPEVVIEEL